MYSVFPPGDEFLTQSDPTDNALAAIASILDHSSEKPDDKPEPEIEEAESETPSDSQHPTPVAEAAEEEAAPALVESVDAEHYTKLGPGPLDAIRFRWTARRDDDGNYFVDETIGPNSRPLVLGPMPSDEVVKFIDDRERAARARFEALKTEMTTGHRAPDRDRYHDRES
ncbi:MAG: hypothetical protein JWR49_2151 [Tardiphaga sp.]|nr:hypothetical protein [Tardiphaga sp.]